MENSSKNNPAFDFFMYLVSFLSLGFVATGVGAILYQIINKFIAEDPLVYAGRFDQGAIKYGIASLIIAAPIYFIFVHLINKRLFNAQTAKDSTVRKWLTYIILFITAATVIGNLIRLIFDFLEGDLVARALLKILTILAIAVAIFGYYFYEIRKKETAGVKHKFDKTIAASFVTILVIILVSSFFLIDSPREARDQKIDREISSDLRQIEGILSDYYIQNGRLPETGTLDELPDNFYMPESSQEADIKYEKIDKKNYKLCANFRRSNLNDDDSREYWDNREHDEGRVCFENQAGSVDNKPMPIIR